VHETEQGISPEHFPVKQTFHKHLSGSAQAFPRKYPFPEKGLVTRFEATDPPRILHDEDHQQGDHSQEERKYKQVKGHNFKSSIAL
jgi:hypothetical protein